ncbi:MAG: glycoside hydrolase family 28 protein [Lachnospiraceae bacterium]|nr:glycoside hydrolase family 28 protein [Lachnospiraceae bacterium]
MLNVLYLGSTSACFELENETPHYAPEPFKIFLDGREIRECETNVFSLFGLKPDEAYVLRIEGGTLKETLELRTLPETCALNVKSFGAAGDGIQEDTQAIQTAINCLPAGGRLFFPEGVYLTLPLMLKSHITLEFSEKAVLLGHPDKGRYPVIPGEVRSLEGRRIFFGGFEGDPKPMYQSLLTGQYAEDIKIIGPGVLNGNAQNTGFWTGFQEDPVARPRLVFLNRCKDVTLHGVTVCNSPSWQLHPYFSDGVRVYDVTVQAPKDSPNTDACDPEACDNVEIIGCHFTVGDDCIAIKSGKIELGMLLNKPADHHTIRNCLMEFGHGAVTLGSEIGAGVRNLSVSQCFFRGTDRGLRIKTRRGRGKNCFIDNVAFENIRMDGVLTPFVINMWYNRCDPDWDSEYVWSREHLPVDERTPKLGSFLFRNIACENAEVAACWIDGLPEAPIEEVAFENVSVSFKPDAKEGIPAMQNFAEPQRKLGLYLDNVRRVRLKEVALEGQEGEKLITKHCEEITDVRGN